MEGGSTREDTAPVFSRQSAAKPISRRNMPHMAADDGKPKLTPEEVEATRMRVPDMRLEDPRERKSGHRVTVDGKPAAPKPRNTPPRSDHRPPDLRTQGQESVDRPPYFPPKVDFDQPPEVAKLGARSIFHERRVLSRQSKGMIDQRYKRQALPSRGLPYTFRDVMIRPLEVPDLIALYDAVSSRSTSAFYDVFDAALDVDVRELTDRDFRWLMYWWRLNSYSKSPWRQPWTSRYGNHQVLILTDTELVVRELQATEEQLRYYTDMGIDFPRLRDAEFLEDQTGWDKVDTYIANRAQYIYTEEVGERWWPSRIEKLMEGGVALMESIRDFENLISDYGVREVATVRDENFVPEAASAYLRQQAELIAEVTLRQGSPSPEYLIAQNEVIDDYVDEADAIDAALVSGQKPEPREESIVLSISTMDFFPAI